MGAETEMSRLDSIPTETLNKLLQMSGQTILPTAVTNPKDGDTLVYDATAKAWKNGAGGGGGGSFVVNVSYDETADTYALDKTAGEIMEAVSKGLVLGLLVSESYTSVLFLVGCGIEGEGETYAEGTYVFFFDWLDDDTTLEFTAATADDYPETERMD